jgi:hypothetical protein
VFELRQSHFTLSLKQHLSDEWNKVKFEIPVDKEYYDSLSVGSEIIDEFRVGSWIMKGSFGNWKMKVINKYTK